MSEISDILNKISEKRELMIDLLKETENPLDPKVIEISQLLDSLLNDYHNYLSKNKT